MVLLLPRTPNDHCEISTLTILHDDVDLLLPFVYDSVVVLHNVRVRQVPQDVNLGDQLLLFLFAHFSVVKLFPDKGFVIAFSPDLANFPKGS